MTEIKDKELQEFWEWCGLYRERESGGLRWFDSQGFLIEEPCIDLNNLFKYAVPKVREEFFVRLSTYFEYWLALIDSQTGEQRGFGKDEDPAQALYQAIQQVRIEEEVGKILDSLDPHSPISLGRVRREICQLFPQPLPKLTEEDKYEAELFHTSPGISMKKLRELVAKKFPQSLDDKELREKIGNELGYVLYCDYDKAGKDTRSSSHSR